ncbi:MAG TPA: class I SAM-dependent methyltransferase [Pyrinomonadaceae bacterium]|nr:class I SAM-dependent methyltransferase [Pyrinomonadaceae bacterium]
MNTKSEKELAFIQDLYVATDWGERFAELVDAHVELPKKGRALYVSAGTGGHAMALQDRAGEKLILTCVDSSEECLELARVKAVTMNQKTEFQRESPGSLSFRDDQFDLVLGNFSMAPHADLQPRLAELVRVARPAGTVAWWTPTFSSFGEFFSIYWEALHNSQLEDHGAEVEHMITELPTVSDLEKMGDAEALENLASWTAIEEFDYDSGEQFLNSPLINDFLLPGWLTPVPETARARVMEELARIIDEERHSGEFALSVKATLVVGRKSRVQ